VGLEEDLSLTSAVLETNDDGLNVDEESEGIVLGTSDPPLESDFVGGKVGLLLGATDRISLSITEALPEGDPLNDLISIAVGAELDGTTDCIEGDFGLLGAVDG
jgi:hypothetical protein